MNPKEKILELHINDKGKLRIIREKEGKTKIIWDGKHFVVYKFKNDWTICGKYKKVMSALCLTSKEYLTLKVF